MPAGAPNPDHDDVRARARAAFVGLAAGDALGAPVEFMTAGEIRTAHRVHREMTGGGWLHLEPGRFTDDTEMSRAIARAIDRLGGFDLRAVADELAAWLKSGPIDAGNTVRKGLRGYIVHGQLESPENEWDAGNGAAMRALPVALLALGDEAALDRWQRAQARLTHHHPLSDAACAALGRMPSWRSGRAPRPRCAARPTGWWPRSPPSGSSPTAGSPPATSWTRCRRPSTASSRPRPSRTASSPP